MCNNRYSVKGEKGCSSKHIDDIVLRKVFVKAFNCFINNKENFNKGWQEKLNDLNTNALLKYRIELFREMANNCEAITTEDINVDFVSKVLDKIVVVDEEKIVVVFLDGNMVEVKVE